MRSAIKLTLLFLFIAALFLNTSDKSFAEIKINGASPADTSNYGAFQNTNYSMTLIPGGGYCEIFGPQDTVPEGCVVNVVQGNNPNRSTVYLFKKPMINGGAIGLLSHATMALYTAPTSSTEYIAHLGGDLGLVDPVYAQVAGSGADLISPVFTLWEVIRNLTYVLFIVVFIIVGFMIMFKQKLNPQTVISIQTALPGLIIGLILVTFSYLIASLLTDVAFYGIPLVAQIFVETKMPNAIATGTDGMIRAANESNIFSLFPTFRLPFGSSVAGSTGDIAATIRQLFLSGATGNASLSAPSNQFGTLLNVMGYALPLLAVTPLGGVGAVAVASPYAISMLIPFVLGIALFIQLFRLFLKLLSAYISILVMSILGPIMILSASLPGKGGSLSTWWKTILANALVFPAVFGAILFAGFVLASVGDSNSWTNPPPLFGGFNPGTIPVLVTYGILLGMPAIPDMVKQAFGIKDNNGIMGAAMAGFAGGFGLGKSGLAKGYESTGIPSDIKNRRDVESKIRSGVVSPPSTPFAVPAGTSFARLREGLMRLPF